MSAVDYLTVEGAFGALEHWQAVRDREVNASRRGAGPLAIIRVLGDLTLPLDIERVESPGEVSSSTVEQRAVVALDHSHARAHDAGQRVNAHASGERIGRERGAQVVDACGYGPRFESWRGRLPKRRLK
jgi:hypothetical protein